MARVADDPRVLRAFELQAAACETMGAPFTARVCMTLADMLDDTSALGRRVIGWPRENRAGDLVPIRTFGGLHALARTGRVADLTAAYPPNRVDDAALRSAIATAIEKEGAFLAAFLDSAPQTNEIGRSAILLGGLLTIAGRTKRPLALHEIGASAGLNQLFDRWRYDLGDGRRWGPSDSPVRIACPWSGNVPDVATQLRIAFRASCDLNPLDPRSAADRERLLSFIWADQTERMARAEAAFEIAAAQATPVEKSDARAWLARVVSPERAQPGVTAVLFHSVFIQYLSPADRQALVADIRRRGEAATAETPFAWLCMEAREDNRAQCELRLMLWPGGITKHLADVDWHGRSAAWA